MSAIPIVAIVGPTAAGKTSLSLDVAEALGGEIVNTDSMQVYAGMDIGTAKLPPAERRGIPHHLLDLLDIDQPASVAEFQRMARGVVDELRFTVSPYLWPTGPRIFERLGAVRLELVGTTTFPSGVVQLRYRPAPTSSSAAT